LIGGRSSVKAVVLGSEYTSGDWEWGELWSMK
jgi:hypothetical protein